MIKKTVVSGTPHHQEEESDNHDKPIVIIGTGLASYNLVKEFRKLDSETPIIIITADDGISYSKPMLSNGFTKNKTVADLAMKDAGAMAKQLHASVWTFTHVTAIDTQNQQIEINHANNISYSKLVIAWGAETIKPPIAGDGLDQVYSINNLLDYDDFRTALTKNKAKKIVIIGGGLIGCEFTNDLINGDFETETIDPLDYCLPTLLPEQAGKAVQNALEEKGAKFHFGHLVTEVNKKDNSDQPASLAVSLNNGEVLDADLVLCAVGVRPRIELAEKAGIQCNRGIVANRLFETSAKNVYTLGDCAEVDGHVLFYVAPLMAGARTLAKTLAGTPTEVSYPAMPVSIKTPACPVVVAPPPRDAQGDWSITQDGNNVVAEFKDKEDKLIGFALTGEGVSEKMRLQKLLPPLLS